MVETHNLIDISSGITPMWFSASDKRENITLLVPIYQRLFVWEEEQIGQLLRDLYDAFKKAPEAPYYIGAITVHIPANQGHWVLVDGQQRMTVLALLGACLRRPNSERGNGQDDLWENFLLIRQGPPRLRYFARDADRKSLEAILDGGATAVNHVANPNMRRFIEVFNRFKREHQNELTAFSRFVYEKATAMVSILPESYGVNELNLYFEKMNAAGKQLEAHEILKVRYFANFAARWNAVADGGRTFIQGAAEKRNGEAESARPATKPATLKELLSLGGLASPKSQNQRIAPDPSRLVMSFPIFLLHVLHITNSSCMNHDPATWNPKNLLTTFDKARRDNGNFAKAFVEKMEQYREWLDRWIIHIEDGAPKSPYGAGNDGSNNNRDDREIVDACSEPLWQFQSMLYVSSDPQQRWVLDAYETYNTGDKKVPETDDGLLAVLKLQDNQRHPLPENCPADWTYGQIDRYWFWKLDYILWERRECKEASANLITDNDERAAVDQYVFRQNRSIEHLYPQNPKDGNALTTEELHSFGNLVMISAAFNSQQGNDDLPTKFGRLRSQIQKKTLESIKLLHMFNEVGGKDTDWKPKLAEEHAKKMVKLMREYYK